MKSIIVNKEQAVHDIFNQYFSSNEPPASREEKPLQDETLPDNKEESLSLDDEEVIKKAAGAANGTKFNSLWCGETSGYKSSSEADMALSQILAYWTGNDAQQMDRLFRRSGLYRPKWDEKRGTDTYGQLTIKKAIKWADHVYYNRMRATMGDTSATEYFTNEYGTFWNKPTKNGEVPVKLCNFVAKINREVIHDDGEQRTIHLEIEVDFRGKKLTVTIPADKFLPMNWLSENCSFQAIMEPGYGLKDRLRHAIQVRSDNISQSHVYTHCGWRDIDDDWFFLHSEGALGSQGKIDGIETELGPLSHYSLPDPPDQQQVRDNLKITLEFFFSLPRSVGIPLLLSIFRAILSEVDPPEVSIHIAGSTGVFKSELAAIAQSAFGHMMSDKRALPGSWTSTANSLERLAFQAKDSILVIDDFAPNGSTADIAGKQRDAERIFRGAGNRHGRGRMNIDGSLRNVNYPRGIIISTGEDIPMGHSLRSRLWVLEINKGEIPPPVLSKGQEIAAQGVLNSLSSAFICWCAERMDDLKESYPKRRQQLRNSLNCEGHARLPTTVADFLTTAEVLGHFAFDTGTFNQEEYEKFLANCRSSLLLAAEQQTEGQQSEDMCVRFFNLLASVISTGRCHVKDQITDNMPDYNLPSIFGWHLHLKFNESSPSGGDAYGKPIGWTNIHGDLYLEPEATYTEVRKLAQEQGHPLSSTQTMLFKTLKEKGHLQSHETSRNTTKVNILGSRRRVIHLNIKQLFDLLTEEEFEEYLEQKSSMTQPQEQAQGDEQWETI